MEGILGMWVPVPLREGLDVCPQPPSLALHRALSRSTVTVRFVNFKKDSPLILRGHQRPLKHWHCDAPAMAWLIPLTPGSMAVRVSPLLWTPLGAVLCLRHREGTPSLLSVGCKAGT